MKCQICNINEAHIVFTQIVNNEKHVMRICTDCAREKGLSIDFETADAPDQGEKTPFDELIDADSKNVDAADELPDLSCFACGLSYRDFKTGGLFGCENCLDAFSEHIKPILKKIHGFEAHTSVLKKKSSPKAKTRSELKELKSSLDHHVALEEYEKAAELRDRINELQEGME